MKTYKNLLSEIQRLQSQAAQRRRKEVSAVIADIRQKMADYGIALDELRLLARKGKAAGGSGAKRGRTGSKKAAKPKRKAAKRKVAPKYRVPQSGATWSGRGLTPKHPLHPLGSE